MTWHPRAWWNKPMVPIMSLFSRPSPQLRQVVQMNQLTWKDWQPTSNRLGHQQTNSPSNSWLFTVRIWVLQFPTIMGFQIYRLILGSEWIRITAPWVSCSKAVESPSLLELLKDNAFTLPGPSGKLHCLFSDSDFSVLQSIGSPYSVGWILSPPVQKSLGDFERLSAQSVSARYRGVAGPAWISEWYGI